MLATPEASRQTLGMDEPNLDAGRVIRLMFASAGTLLVVIGGTMLLEATVEDGFVQFMGLLVSTMGLVFLISASVAIGVRLARL